VKAPAPAMKNSEGVDLREDLVWCALTKLTNREQQEIKSV
jgi:hypothetical protein